MISGTEVWVLVTNNKYGVDISVHSTEEKAKRTLVKYVRTFWENTMGDEDQPTDDDEAIAAFYHENEREDYVMQNETVDYAVC